MMISIGDWLLKFELYNSISTHNASIIFYSCGCFGLCVLLHLEPQVLPKVPIRKKMCLLPSRKKDVWHEKCIENLEILLSDSSEHRHERCMNGI
jgi:hypothetical protein